MTEPTDLFRPDWETVLRLLVKTSRSSIHYAHGMAYRQPGNTDRAEDHMATVPAANAWDALDALQRDVEMSHLGSLSEPPRSSVSGAPPEPIDKLAFRMERKRVKRQLGDVIKAHTGEEGWDETWQEFQSLGAGEFGLLTDSVDGTTVQRALRVGFSNNMGLYEALGDSRFQLQATICSSSSMETMVSDLRDGSVTMIGPAGQRKIVTNDMPRTKAVAGSVAIVAARGKTRAEYSGLFDPLLSLGLAPITYGNTTTYDPAPDVFTVGGAPILIGFPLSELQYLVVPHWQTPYDAFPLLGCLMSGHSYLLRDGRSIDADEMAARMSVVTSPNGVNPKPVPPGLLVRQGASPDVTDRLLEALHRLVEDPSSN